MHTLARTPPSARTHADIVLLSFFFSPRMPYVSYDPPLHTGGTSTRGFLSGTRSLSPCVPSNSPTYAPVFMSVFSSHMHWHVCATRVRICVCVFIYTCIYIVYMYTRVNMVIHHHRQRYVNKLDLSSVAGRRDARGSSMGTVPKEGRTRRECAIKKRKET